MTRPLTLTGVVPYPPAAAARYRAAGYWTDETLDDLLRSAVADAPGATAVVDAVRTLSYAELDDWVTRVACGLRARGLGRGDRVVVQLPNRAELVVVLFALFRLGAVPVLALPAHRRSEIEHFSRHTRAVAIVTCATHAGFDHAALATEVAALVPGLRVVLAEDLPEADGDVPPGAADASDVAFLQLSGGSTGRPKLIPRTHADYLYSVRESARICGLTDRSVLLAVLPAVHNFPMSSPGFLGVVHARGTLVLSADASPAATFRLVAEHGVTIVPAVPPLLLSWLNSPDRPAADLSSLELVQVGGAPLARTVAARVQPELGCRLQQVFGMAEGLVCYTRDDDDEQTVLTTQGRPISADDEVLVVDDDDRPVPPGAPGHLLVRGPYTIRGYYREPEHDARAFTVDGFYRTGDVVVARGDGALTVVGRAKDQINRGGEKIAPQEVEEHLLTHPAVHDVSVVAEPDEVLGERVLAYVVARGGHAEPRPVELRRHLAARGLATYKVPDVFRLVVALPGTGVGKVDRTRLAAAGESTW
ncbi:(2,3-dihydroxybenzoyl)adenylate synthase [Cellulomonas sp. Leaf334]|uniref:(2,3-dihydroxybenzoyl)adenylate synthase n=1 Tax=Cellulomonas sp. Leaf334 TaxID=1736339 RepID=UPI0006F23C2A|nr:AMP-binding protein [Cellulomonas sp. Leaf334]KQR16493.1 2,3-dihydroxybenzoate-AMP ligase [Cellulomonas sp. Leaf334]